MTQRDAISVAAKVLGIYMLAMGIVGLPQSIETVRMFARPGFRGEDQAAWMLAQIVSILLWFGTAIVLLVCSDAIGKRMGGVRGEAPISGTLGSEQALFHPALRVLGVIIISIALPELLSGLARNALAYCQFASKAGGPVGAFDIANSLWVTQWTAVVKAAISFAIGAYLIWGAEHFTRLVFRARRTEQAAE